MKIKNLFEEDELMYNPESKSTGEGLPSSNAFVEYVPPSTPTELELTALVENVLNIRSVGVHDDFFDNGAHSLVILKIISAIILTFNVEIGILDVVKNCTISSLATLIDKRKRSTGGIDLDLIRGKIDESFPLSPIQLSYLLGRESQIELGGVSTQAYLEFTAQIEIDRFSQAFNKLIVIHPMLRAVMLKDGKQRILNDVSYIVPVVDAVVNWEEERESIIETMRSQLSHKIFDPYQWPLFELKAIHTGRDAYYIFFGIDTIIADGPSKDILFRDLLSLYKGEPVASPGLTFQDYMLSLCRYRQKDVYEKSRRFWKEKLADFPDAPALPTVRYVADIDKPHFEKVVHKLTELEWKTIEQVASEKKVSPTSILLSAFSTVLSYYSGQQRFAINLTTFNRIPFHKDVASLVGDFTSLLILDVDINITQMPGSFFQINRNLVEALEYRAYDGVEFLRELAKLKKSSNLALMPVVFTSLIYGKSIDRNNTAANAESLNIKGQYRINQSSQVTLDCIVSDVAGDLSIQWNYVLELFDQGTIRKMFDDYTDQLHQIIQARDIPSIAEFKSARITESIYQHYNASFFETEPTTLVTLYNNSCRRLPENVCVRKKDNSLSYREMEARSNQFANYLTSGSVTRGDRVGILGHRNISTIVAIIGILKTGAAFVPLDPDSSPDRISYIIGDCGCSAVIDLKEDKLLVNEYSTSFSVPEILPSDLAYIIFTSGSSGKPKGVAISHGAASNTIEDINNRFSVTSKDRILGISALTFDLSIFDIFGSFHAGASLVLIDDIRDVDHIITLLRNERITIFNAVPAVMAMITDSLETGATHQAQSSPRKQEASNALFYWAPTFHWVEKDNKIFIENIECPPVASALFPQFYFKTQDGILLDDLLAGFSSSNQSAVQEFIKTLITRKVLINDLQEPQDLYRSQNKFVVREISGPAVESKPFHSEVITLSDHSGIQLDTSYELPERLFRRRSARNFLSDEIKFSLFRSLLAVLRKRRIEDETMYNYASAGALYPISMYFFVKRGRLEGVEEGLYYYDSEGHQLRMLSDFNIADIDYHFPINHSAHLSSALSIFFVYRSHASLKKYGGMGYHYATIETGEIMQLLSEYGTNLGIGFCSIGDIRFGLIRDHFKLEKGDVLLHSALLGAVESRACVQCVGDPKGRHLHRRDKSQGFYLEKIMLSGDWVPVDMPSRLSKIFENAIVIAMGGATEASIWSNYYLPNPSELFERSVPYGRPLGNQQLYILNQFQMLCPPNVVGEISIGGRGVADGYYNDPEKTAAAFIEHKNFGRIYRTGDFGVFRLSPDKGLNENKNGYIEFLGRKDTQVKIRGFRIELAEIESALGECANVRNVAVIVKKEQNDRKFIVAYIVTDGSDKSAILSQLRLKLPEYMIPAAIVEMDKLPLTANGKIDRKKLESIDVKINPAEDRPAAGPLQEKLLLFYNEVLETSVSSVSDNFFELGGNSLTVLKLSQKVRLLGFDVQIRDFFQFQTVEALAEFLEGKLKSAEQTENQAAKTLDFGDMKNGSDYQITVSDFYWLNSLSDPELKKQNKRFHGPVTLVYEISGQLDAALIHLSLDEVRQRYESLRSSFYLKNDKGYLHVHQQPKDLPYFTFEDLSGHISGAFSELEKTFFEDIPKFDFYTGHLFFVKLVKLEPSRHVLVVNVHHIIFDRYSIGILLRDLFLFYRSHVSNDPYPFPPLKYNYSNFLHDYNLNILLNHEQHLQYWAKLNPVLPPDALIPLDVAVSPAEAELKGKAAEIEVAELEQWQYEIVTLLTKKMATSQFVILQATLLNFLMHRTGQHDFTYGTRALGRDFPGTEQLIGNFAKTLLIRSQLIPEANFEEIVKVVDKANEDMSVYSASSLADTLDQMVAERGQYIVGTFWRFNINYRTSGGYLIENEYINNIENQFSIKQIHHPDQAGIAVIDLQFDFVSYPDKIILEVRSDSSKYLLKDVKKMLEEYLAYYKNLTSYGEFIAPNDRQSVH